MKLKCGARGYLDVRVTMRDGIDLATHIFLPAEDGSFPAMLMRNPYNALRQNDMLDWVKRGYAYVLQDTRGRFASSGDFYPFFNEENDGADTLAWIADQPWCDGHIVMYGGSYKSATQIAAAKSGHPALKAFSPSCMASEFHHCFYWGGAPRLAWQTGWTFAPGEGVTQDEIRNHLPLQEMDVFASGRVSPFWRDMLAHPRYDEYWRKMATGERFHQIKAPAFIRSGWFDLFVGDIFDLYNGMKTNGGSRDARRHTRIIVGPWGHSIGQRKIGEVDFGPAVTIDDLYEQELAFFDHFAERPGEPFVAVPPVKIFVMGRNEWRDEHEWPLARTRHTEMFLASDGGANTASGDGRLASVPSGSDDTFKYDPDNPVPTKGGAWDFSNIGPCDQREIESRDDVLVYTSDELRDDLEVTGHVIVILFASSSAVQTDFTAKLVDLKPDGKAMSVCDGIVNTQHGDSTLIPSQQVSDQIYEVKIRLTPTSHVFFRGHKLRVEIASCNFPAFARNLNTDQPLATAVKGCPTIQKIHHSETCPSRVVLPVISPAGAFDEAKR